MKFSVLSFKFVDDELGMSFGSGSDCPQASQMFCDKRNNQRNSTQCGTNTCHTLLKNLFTPGRRYFPASCSSMWVTL